MLRYGSERLQYLHLLHLSIPKEFLELALEGFKITSEKYKIHSSSSSYYY